MCDINFHMWISPDAYLYSYVYSYNLYAEVFKLLLFWAQMSALKCLYRWWHLNESNVYIVDCFWVYVNWSLSKTQTHNFHSFIAVTFSHFGATLRWCIYCLLEQLHTYIKYDFRFDGDTAYTWFLMWIHTRSMCKLVCTYIQKRDWHIHLRTVSVQSFNSRLMRSMS